VQRLAELCQELASSTPLAALDLGKIDRARGAGLREASLGEAAMLTQRLSEGVPPRITDTTASGRVSVGFFRKARTAAASVRSSSVASMRRPSMLGRFIGACRVISS
jgi:hypothetical protein